MPNNPPHRLPPRCKHQRGSSTCRGLTNLVAGSYSEPFRPAR
jgi:hypothetical protein